MLIFLYNESDYKFMTKTHSNIDYLLKCYYYSTNIPVRMYINNEEISSYPSKINMAESIIGYKDNAPTILQKDKKIKIIQNRYKEIMVEIKYNDQTIIVGPFLNESIDVGTITNMTRNNIIPFHQKSEIQKYYNNLQILSSKKIYYQISLLNELINNKKTNIKENIKSKKEAKNNNDEYYKQKDEYRINQFLHPPYFIEKEISKYICNGDINNAKSILKEINIQPHAKLASTSLRSFRNSMICSCSYMTRAAIDGGVNQDEAFTLSDSFINQIENIQTIDELSELEYKMVEKFAGKVKEKKTQKYSPSILTCIDYIDNHLCDDLSLKTLSKAIYLNESYLSSLFHKETGKTLRKWIIEKRIEESARMIKNGNNSIAEISYLYKFCSQSYFIQCFKNKMHVTPKEYKFNH